MDRETFTQSIRQFRIRTPYRPFTVVTGAAAAMKSTGPMQSLNATGWQFTPAPAAYP